MKGLGRAGVAVLAGTLLCAPAAAAGPRAGERYDGSSATGNLSMLTVSADGTRLKRYFLGVTTRCSDGVRRRQGLIQRGERPVVIDAAGSFSYRSRPQRYTYADGASGRSQLSFTGTFDASGDTVSGTIEATFRSRRADCTSGPVQYTLHRNGSAGAPFRNALMATGRYTVRGRGVRARLRTHAPSRALMRTVLSYRFRCRGGRSVRATSSWRPEQLSPAGRVRMFGPLSFRVGGTSWTFRARYRLVVRFSGGTQVSGRWRLRGALSSGGRRIDTCRMNRSFRGSFVRGPV